MNFHLTSFAAVTGVALLGLAGCQRADDNRTAGQQLDEAIAKTQQKAAESNETIKQTSREVGQAMGNATDAVANKSRDAAITASVKTQLVGDSSLSALSINVDTSGGRVVLRGSAPTSMARDRATQLARAVDGVSAVENELRVQAQP